MAQDVNIPINIFLRDGGIDQLVRGTRDAREELDRVEREGSQAFTKVAKEAGVAAGATGKTAQESRKLTGIIGKLENEYQELGRKIKEAQNIDDVKRFRQEQAKVKKELQGIDKATAPIADNAKNAQSAFSGMGSSVKNIVGALGLAAAGTAAFSFVVGEVNEAVRELNKATQTAAVLFQTTGARAEVLASEARVIAKVFDEDINEVLQAANVLAEEFGITGEDALAVINTGFEKGANVRGEFLDQLKEYGTFFDALGLSADQAIAVITQQEESGTFSDKGVDTLKEFALSLRELTKPAQEALDAIGLSGEELQRQVREGNITVFEAAQLVSERLNELPEQSKEVGQVFADVFKGAGEDARGFVFDLENVTVNLDEIESRTTDAEKASRDLTQAWTEFTNGVAEGEGVIGGALTALKQGIADILQGQGFLFESLGEQRRRIVEEGADAFIQQGVRDAEKDFEGYLNTRRKGIQELLDDELISEEEAQKRLNASRTQLAVEFVQNQYVPILQRRNTELAAANEALQKEDNEENRAAVARAERNLKAVEEQAEAITNLGARIKDNTKKASGFNEELDKLGDGEGDPAPPAKIEAAAGSLADLQKKLKEVRQELSGADPNDIRLLTSLTSEADALTESIEIAQARLELLSDTATISPRGTESPEATGAPNALTVPLEFQTNQEDFQSEMGAIEEDLRSTFEGVQNEVENLGGQLDSVLGTDGLDSLFSSLTVFFSDELPEGISKSDAALAAAAAGIAVIGGALNNFYGEQLENNQGFIESLNTRIDEQNAAIEREQEAADAGRANNLAAEKATQQELIAERRAALQEQEKIQRRQAAIQALQQASALAVTAAQLFASQAPKGIAGVAIAAGLLTTVLGLFNSFKQKSQAEVFAREGYADILGGDLHTAGGNNLSHIEAERGEAVGVLSRKATARHGKDFISMVEALNKGKKPEMTFSDVVVDKETVNEPLRIQMNGEARADSGAALLSRLSSIEKLLSGWPHQVAGVPGGVIFREQSGKKQTIKIQGND